jgi:predicted enzyme related to lactoylglutathione lyase
MRTLLLSASLVLILMSGPLHASSSPATKALPADVGPGRVAWFDISTKDLVQAKEFYGQLFEWTFGPVMGTDQAVEILSRATAIGTLRSADGAIGVFNGVVYIQVTDLPASCAKAKDLGGTVPPGFPFDLPDGAGAIALVVDPSGHPVGLYSRSRLPATAPAGTGTR